MERGRGQRAGTLLVVAWAAVLACEPLRPETAAGEPRSRSVAAPSEASTRVAGDVSTGGATERSPSVASLDQSSATTVRLPTVLRRDRRSSAAERVNVAADAKGDVVREMVAQAGLRWPPKQLLFRAFKAELRLEVWAADTARGPLTQVATYGICATSGHLGPKRREGDGQVPEGFYRIDHFKKRSDYHLAMRISYPNASDRILGDSKHPGSAIMIHGDCASIGCLAMSDERIEELWVLARSASSPIDVHIFPTRSMKALLAERDESTHRAFWQNLQEGLERFEQTRRLFEVRVDPDGRYRFAGPLRPEAQEPLAGR